MVDMMPKSELHPGFSDPRAKATPWEVGREILQTAEIFWLSTVRRDGRPHVTPLIAVMVDGALFFTTGEGEQKYANLQANPHVVLTTGTNVISDGIDVIVEGTATRVSDDELLQRVAAEYVRKYGDDWAFEARDGALHHAEGGAAIAFRVEPVKAFGFSKGDPFGQTRWRFS